MSARKYVLSVCLLLSCLGGYAWNDSLSVSYCWNEDSTITFTYIDTTAKRVVLIGNCMLPKEDLSFSGRQMRQRMQEVQPGVWQCRTMRRLTPELYTYQIIVDGHRHTDPMNPDSIWVRNQRKSVLLVDGDEQTNLYKPAAQQGRAEAVSFVAEDGVRFRMMVYLPYNYHDTEVYPVLYLFHGINGDQRNWIEQGRICNILDNLIQRGDIQPLVVVMPRCLLSEPRHPDHVESTNVFNYGEILKGRFEKRFPEIEQYIYAHYSVQRQDNAIAGLSCGARQAANIANMEPGIYTRVGMFSPVVSRKQQPVVQLDTSLYPKYWVGGGTNDWMFLSDARSFVRGLEEKGVEHVYMEIKGGHTFTNWRVFVTRFLRWAFPITSIDINYNREL